MNPLDWMRAIYGWLGADYPKASLCAAIVLGAFIGGAAWKFAEHIYKNHADTSLQPRSTVNATSGQLSPIMPSNQGDVTITDGQPTPPTPTGKSK